MTKQSRVKIKTITAALDCTVIGQRMFQKINSTDFKGTVSQDGD
jgi:hypothetical protein